MREAVARPGPRAARVIGYVMRDERGVRLVDALRSDGASFIPVGGAGLQICLVPAASEAARLAALTPNSASAMLAIISGTFAVADAGLAPVCGFRIADARAEVLTPRDATVETLLERPQEYAGAVVRVTGGLLARPGAALLVESLGVGGVPAPGARQLKLAAPLMEEALPDGLRQSPGGAVRFGSVQVEGLWRDGVLVPLAVVALTE